MKKIWKLSFDGVCIMKTIRLKYVDGRYDIDTAYGKSIILDSENTTQRTEIAEQRYIKILRSKQNFFNADYGIDINQFVGKSKRISIVSIMSGFERAKTFYRKTYSRSGNIGVKNLNIKAVTDTSFIVEIQLANEKIPVAISTGGTI